MERMMLSSETFIRINDKVNILFANPLYSGHCAGTYIHCLTGVLEQLHEAGYFFIPVSQVRQLRLREIK